MRSAKASPSPRRSSLHIFVRRPSISWRPYPATSPPRRFESVSTELHPFTDLFLRASRNTFLSRDYIGDLLRRRRPLGDRTTGEIRNPSTHCAPRCRGRAKQKSFWHYSFGSLRPRNI